MRAVSVRVAWVRSGGGYEVSVRFEDEGCQSAFTLGELPRWRSRDRVRVVDGHLQPN